MSPQWPRAGHAGGVVETTVYTDGSCLGNPGPGGWAWAVPVGPYASGAEPSTTNQRMEITAVLRAVEAIGGAVHVVSDSTYVVNCFRDRWWEAWRRRDWRNSAGKPVANRDLWEPLVAVVVDSGRAIRLDWVKGHSGDPMNERVDLLATEAAVSQRAVSGRAWETDGTT
jgi:ribonuclease HI